MTVKLCRYGLTIWRWRKGGGGGIFLIFPLAAKLVWGMIIIAVFYLQFCWWLKSVNWFDVFVVFQTMCQLVLASPTWCYKPCWFCWRKCRLLWVAFLWHPSLPFLVVSARSTECSSVSSEPCLQCFVLTCLWSDHLVLCWLLECMMAETLTGLILI